MQTTVRGSGSSIGMQADAITAELVAATGRLAALSGERAALEKRLSLTARGDEAVRQSIMKEISANDAEIAEQKARIDQFKTMIGDLKTGEPVILVPPALPGSFHENTVFGMNKDEFLSVFILLITLPIVAAVTRRLWRRPTKQTPSALDNERFARLEQAVEAVAIEVERIGESQRYQAKLMAERPVKAELRSPGVRTPV